MTVDAAKGADTSADVTACACGDHTCDKGEDGQNCPTDCGYCGDGICSDSPALGERGGLCPADCKD